MEDASRIANQARANGHASANGAGNGAGRPPGADLIGGAAGTARRAAMAGAGVAGGLLGKLAGRFASRLSADFDDRDPDYIREQLPLQWLISSLWIAFVSALIGALAAGLWAWIRYRELSQRSPVLVGVRCAIALLPVLFASASIRATIAEAYFPYVLWFRWGYAGIFFLWSALSVLACGVVVAGVVHWSNLTTRWSGP